jgi:hypothetical protein
MFNDNLKTVLWILVTVEGLFCGWGIFIRVDMTTKSEQSKIHERQFLVPKPHMTTFGVETCSNRIPPSDSITSMTAENCRV